MKPWLFPYDSSVLTFIVMGVTFTLCWKWTHRNYHHKKFSWSKDLYFDWPASLAFYGISLGAAYLVMQGEHGVEYEVNKWFGWDHFGRSAHYSWALIFGVTRGLILNAPMWFFPEKMMIWEDKFVLKHIMGEYQRPLNQLARVEKMTLIEALQLSKGHLKFFNLSFFSQGLCLQWQEGGYLFLLVEDLESVERKFAHILETNPGISEKVSDHSAA